MPPKRGSKGGVAGKVANMSKSWGKARKTTTADKGFGEFVPVDAGNYKMQLVKAVADVFGDAHKMHLSFVVVGDREEAGEICQTFEGFGSEDRDVWMQRLLVRMGCTDEDLDTVEKQGDLVALFDAMVEEYRCFQVQVKEKDGYLNLRVRKVVTMDEEYLFEPADALSDGDSEGDSESDDSDDDDDDDDEAWEIGDRVQFERKGVTILGVIKGFDDDDNALVLPDGKKRKVKVDQDDLDTEADDDADDATDDSEDDAEGEEAADDPEEEAPADDEDDSEPALNVGDSVLTEEYGAGFPCKILSISPKAGAKTPFLVEFEDGDKDNFARGDLTLVKGDDDADEPEEDTPDELEVGDRVVVPHNGDDKPGEVKKIKGSKVQVKLDGVKKPVWVPLDKVNYELDD